MDLAASGLGRNHPIEKGQKVMAGVARRRHALDLPRAHVERGVGRERPVAHVLEAVPLRAAGREWQDGVTPVERLDAGLLILAEDDCVGRRVEIEPDHIGGLLLEVGIGAGDDTERTELDAMARSRTLAAGLVERARGILPLAGEAYASFAPRLDTSTTTLTRWRRRFEQQRIAGLHDAPRGGRGDRISPALEARILALTRTGRLESATPCTTGARVAEAEH